MLVLDPERVVFGGAVWESVESVLIDRRAQKTVAEWSDSGPYAVLADVPEQRVVVKVAQRLNTTDLTTPVPGDLATLSFEASPNKSAADRVQISVGAVLVSVVYGAGDQAGARRTFELVAVSPDGGSDPVSVTPIV